MATQDFIERIQRRKAELGPRLLLLTHHYQRPEIVALGDERGDSYQLAELASRRAEAEFIVFCGVRFMAEAARVLAQPGQRVFHPVPTAGCPMADMAELPLVERAWAHLERSLPGKRVVPIVYMNSSAAAKDFCGRHGGAVCTSSNAGQALEWGLSQGDVLLFFPDQHLGRNTAARLGLPTTQVALWQRALPDGGLAPEDLQRARLLLWDGFCHVHTWFTPEQVDHARRQHPQGRVIVHPECDRAVLKKADGAGSTGYIVKAVREARPGDVLIIGTELNLVTRLAAEHPDRTVVPLSPSLCPNMYSITPRALAEELEALPGGRHEVFVDPQVGAGARLALERMLTLGG
jgi:quinolinate synthase